MMIRAGIPATPENYQKLIDEGWRLEELSEKANLDMNVKKGTPKAWGSASTYME